MRACRSVVSALSAVVQSLMLLQKVTFAVSHYSAVASRGPVAELEMNVENETILMRQQMRLRAFLIIRASTEANRFFITEAPET